MSRTKFGINKLLNDVKFLKVKISELFAADLFDTAIYKHLLVEEFVFHKNH